LISERFASIQRKSILSVAILFCAAGLGFRLFQMQILNQTLYETKSANNSIKQIEQIPLRGVFYDRNHKLLVNNVPAYTLRITPLDYDTRLNNLLEKVLDLDSGYVSSMLDQYKGFSKYLPIKIKRGVDFSAISWFEENSRHLPGVDYIIEMHRGYPGGVNGSHIFGYTKEITRKQLEENKETYKSGDVIGYNGIEETYDQQLKGSKGRRFILVDSRQKEIGSYNDGTDDLLPVRGTDVILTIETSTQKAAEEEFKNRRGALVAIDPNTGEILAMVSSPQYDLDKFSYITSQEFLNQLYNDPDKPLFNRATMSIQSPGSTYKMLAAIAALDLGVITPTSTIYCGGGVTFGRFFKCHGVHGSINVVQAIEKSCNSFFYQLIFKIGLDRWAEYCRRFGFDAKTNVDLDEESPGLIPDSKYYVKTFGANWPRSILLSLSIGQGEVGVSTLQLAQYTALIANNGKSFTPHLVRSYINSDEQEVYLKTHPIDVGIDKKVFDVVKEGMYLVVNGSGTATNIRSDEYVISGKTGTAQNPHGKDHAWFVAFAPFDHPQIAVALIVENVGFGATYAAPIAKRVIETYLNSLKDKPVKENKTLVKLEKIISEQSGEN